MLLKLSQGANGYLGQDTSAEEKEFDISEQELIDFQRGYLLIKQLEDGSLVKTIDDTLLNEYLENEKRNKINQAIEAIGSRDDLLIMIAEVLDKLTEGHTDDYIVEAKKNFAKIKEILEL